MKATCILIILATTIFLQSCKNDQNNTSVSIFCAAGLTDVIKEISDTFRIHTNSDLLINFASSGTLARQLELGNPADIYISANKKWADYIHKLHDEPERKPLYKNNLVLIAPINSGIDTIRLSPTVYPDDFVVGPIAIGDPDHVPAGQYARQALVNLNLYDHIRERIIPTKDVRSALRLVELNECKLGIVYASDVLKSNKAKVVDTFPSNSHDPIIFHALLLNTESKPAREFFTLLTDQSVSFIWEKNGFTIPE